METAIMYSPPRGNSMNKSHLSPKRSSSAATAMSSMLQKTSSKSTTKNVAATPQTPAEANFAWVPPTPTVESTMSKSHHVTLEVGNLSLKNIADKFSSSLMLKLSCEGSSKMLGQNGFTHDGSIAKFTINGDFGFPTKNLVPRIVVEVMMGNSVLATGVMSVDIAMHMSCPVKNNAGELSRWNKFPLAAQKMTKHVQVTEIVGEIEASFDVKGETYWSDSESGGTLTNSLATTPASTVGSIQSGRTPATVGGTPKLRPTLGISPNPVPVGPPNQVLTPKQGDKENTTNKFAGKDFKSTGKKPSSFAPKATVSFEVDQAPGVSLNSDLAAESEASAKPVVKDSAPTNSRKVPEPVEPVEPVDTVTDATTGRLIWFGIVLLHMFLQA